MKRTLKRAQSAEGSNGGGEMLERGEKKPTKVPRFTETPNMTNRGGFDTYKQLCDVEIDRSGKVRHKRTYTYIHINI